MIIEELVYLYIIFFVCFVLFFCVLSRTSSLCIWSHEIMFDEIAQQCTAESVHKDTNTSATVLCMPGIANHISGDFNLQTSSWSVNQLDIFTQ